MPRPLKRRLARTNVTGPITIDRLLSGHGFFEDPILDEDQLREVWEEMREELLTDFVAEHPGRRPWAWWEFDAPEPRRRTGEAPEPIGKGFWFGTPRCSIGIPSKDAYETEQAYLDRLGLLSDAERNAIGRNEP